VGTVPGERKIKKNRHGESLRASLIDGSQKKRETEKGWGERGLRTRTKKRRQKAQRRLWATAHIRKKKKTRRRQLVPEEGGEGSSRGWSPPFAMEWKEKRGSLDE